MTRKAYRAIAESLGILLANSPDEEHRGAWKAIYVFCDAIKEDNPRFERGKFVDAINAKRDDIHHRREFRNALNHDAPTR